MRIQIRSKQNGRIEVRDEHGEIIKNVLSVSFSADGKNPEPIVTLRCLADIVVNAEAKIEQVERQAPKPPAMSAQKER